MTKTTIILSTAFLLTASATFAAEMRGAVPASTLLEAAAGDTSLIGSGDRDGFWSNVRDRVRGLEDSRYRERQASYDDRYDDDDDYYDDDDYDDRDWSDRSDSSWSSDRDGSDWSDDRDYDDDYDDDDDDDDDYDDDYDDD